MPAPASIVGIDPGLEGALALLDGAGRLVHVLDMPTAPGRSGKSEVSAALLADIFRSWKPNVVMLEEVGARPGNGVAGMFKFGRSFGIIEGVVAALSITMLLASPAVWKRSMKVTADKSGCRLMAQRLWPDQAAQFQLVKHDGRAEAALIALYGRSRWVLP